MPTVIYSQNWDSVLNGDATFNCSRTTVTPIEGAGSLLFNLTATSGYWLKNAVSGGRDLVFQFKIRFTTLPNATVTQIAGTYHLGNGIMGIGWDLPTGKFYNEMEHIPGGTPGGPVIATGQTYTIDLLLRGSTPTFTVDSMVDGVALPQLSDGGNTPENFGDYRMAIETPAATTQVRMDSLLISDNPADYPITFMPTPSVAWFTA